MLDHSTLSVDNLDTRLSTTGVEAEASSLHAMDWLADRHQLGLSLDDASTATVRTFDASGGTGSSDAFGGGDSCGAAAQAPGCKPQPTTASSKRRSPSPTSTATHRGRITVHGFHLTSDVNGAATLPLLSGGSDVVALATVRA